MVTKLLIVKIPKRDAYSKNVSHLVLGWIKIKKGVASPFS